jgi:hypothetical protein
MKTIDVSGWRLKLHSDGVLDYTRSTDGAKVEHWKPKPKYHSKLPPFFFGNTISRIIKAVARVGEAHKKTYKNLRPAILDALTEAGESADLFTVKRDSDYGDVVWLCHGRRYAVFQVCDRTEHRANLTEQELHTQLRDDETDVGRRFRNMERKSGALLRIAFVIGKGGFCRMVPGRWRGEDNE